MNIYRIGVLDGVLPGWHWWHYRTKKEALKAAREEAKAHSDNPDCRVVAYAIKLGTGKDAIIGALNSAGEITLGGTEIFYWGGADDVLEG